MNDKHTYVLTGICRTQAQIEKAGIDIFEVEDNCAPLSVKYGEGDKFYIGKVIAESVPDGGYASHVLSFPSHQEIAHELDQHGFNVCGHDINNWFFDTFE